MRGLIMWRVKVLVTIDTVSYLMRALAVNYLLNSLYEMVTIFMRRVRWAENPGLPEPFRMCVVWDKVPRGSENCSLGKPEFRAKA